ncbi:putative flavin-containing monooxygenase [Burkholderia pseudomallei]|uniref:monooxygenase n=1 Tax=Burkholderia pseudomallei TaxID=28450 RepID=UPI0019EA9338|nr:monooxygenase [Burkholderia pseudomallei]MBF3855738.1 monooxygenase [Burkholderia pseudomallei]MBO3056034.1 monooxygenase [Burkholderia pseudomallei]CAJ9622558.1 putative flavin-containing monooxygenase [Burkholderia pseudomallei]
MEIGLTTNRLAQRLGLQPDTLRVALCRRGSYFGVKPTKLPNGRLVWPHDTVERIVALYSASVQ